MELGILAKVRRIPGASTGTQISPKPKAASAKRRPAATAFLAAAATLTFVWSSADRTLEESASPPELVAYFVDTAGIDHSRWSVAKSVWSGTPCTDSAPGADTIVWLPIKKLLAGMPSTDRLSLSVGTHGRPGFSEDSDAFLQVQALWSPYGVHLRCEVTDDEYCRPIEFTSDFEGEAYHAWFDRFADAIDLYFDNKPSSDVGQGADDLWRPDTCRLTRTSVNIACRFAQDLGSNDGYLSTFFSCYDRANDTMYSRYFGSDPGADYPERDYAVRRSDDGLARCFEWLIPWAAIGAGGLRLEQARALGRIAFTVAYHDCDDPTRRETQDLCWRNRSYPALDLTSLGPEDSLARDCWGDLVFGPPLSELLTQEQVSGHDRHAPQVQVTRQADGTVLFTVLGGTSARAEFDVLDASGRLVARPHVRSTADGAEAQWSRGDTGYAPGLYIARARFPENVVAQKFAIMP